MLNLVELKRWRDYLANVPDELVDMENYRDGQSSTPLCDSVGCVVGHCTGLYQYDELPMNDSDLINFTEVPRKFLNIDYVTDVWKFLFSSVWGCECNTETCGTQKAFALHRMDYVLKYGDAPVYWTYDMTPSDFVI